MGKQTLTGFTVIEVMLFLAVTGMLAIGILVGSGVAIGQQRYRDSVSSLKSFIQQQYNEVANVVNSRNKGWACDSTGAITEVPSGQPRGTSECVFLGRLITVNSGGTELRSANVTAYRIPGTPEGASDVAEIANYRLSISPIDQEVEEVAWGAQVVKQDTAAPMPVSILIVRSPLSGSLLTFTAEGVTTNLNSLATVANTNTPRSLCMNADVGTFVGRRMEVRIDPNATNQSGVRIPPESESVCD